jgi:hypothetical protein
LPDRRVFREHNGVVAVRLALESHNDAYGDPRDDKKKEC